MKLFSFCVNDASDPAPYTVSAALSREGVRYRTEDPPFSDPGLPMPGGSLAHTVTALITVLLLREGKITLGTRIRSILPAYPFEKHTVFHIMTHTAALAPFPHPCTSDYGTDFLASLACIGAPGEAMQYAPCGYTVLWMLCEACTGADPAHLAEALLFSPLSMENTAFRPSRGEERIPMLITTAADMLSMGEELLTAVREGNSRVFHPGEARLAFGNTAHLWENRSPVLCRCTRDAPVSELCSRNTWMSAGPDGNQLVMDPENGICYALLSDMTLPDASTLRGLGNRLYTTAYGVPSVWKPKL